MGSPWRTINHGPLHKRFLFDYPLLADRGNGLGQGGVSQEKADRFWEIFRGGNRLGRRFRAPIGRVEFPPRSFVVAQSLYGGGEALSFQRARLLQRFSFWRESGTVLFRAHLGSRSSRARLCFSSRPTFRRTLLGRRVFIHRRARRRGARRIFRPTLPSAGASTAGDRPGGGGRTGASFSRDRLGRRGRRFGLDISIDSPLQNRFRTQRSGLHFPNLQKRPLSFRVRRVF